VVHLHGQRPASLSAVAAPAAAAAAAAAEQPALPSTGRSRRQRRAAVSCPDDRGAAGSPCPARRPINLHTSQRALDALEPLATAPSGNRDFLAACSRSKCTSDGSKQWIVRLTAGCSPRGGTAGVLHWSHAPQLSDGLAARRVATRRGTLRPKPGSITSNMWIDSKPLLQPMSKKVRAPPPVAAGWGDGRKGVRRGAIEGGGRRPDTRRPDTRHVPSALPVRGRSSKSPRAARAVPGHQAGRAGRAHLEISAAMHEPGRRSSGNRLGSAEGTSWPADLPPPVCRARWGAGCACQPPLRGWRRSHCPGPAAAGKLPHK
jgi:hypothetical protein